tara:strand:- start:1712 stop:2626 length:915 start_codon:yes stop_codon:yes gene_type:complete
MHSKKLIHTLKSRLSTEHQISIKNSHIHELIASWNGYKSKASMNISGAFVFDDFGYPEEREDLDLFFSRGASFGYSSPELTELNNEIIFTLEKLNLNFIEYEHFPLEKPPHRDGYWYRKKEEGTKLSSAQAEFANGYEQLLSTFEKDKDHLANTANNGSYKAALRLASFYDDSDEFHEIENDKAVVWYKVAAKLGSIDAKANLGLYYNDSQFLVEAAKCGNSYCINEIARQENLPENIHYWNEVAKLYGYDITASTGINDGGNWYVDHEGINLPALSEEGKNEAKKRAMATFDKYSEDYKEYEY